MINPDSPEVAPWVTMMLTGMPFAPITARWYGAPTLSMPVLRAAPMLDASGRVAN